MTQPWDKHLTPRTAFRFRAHDLDFIITTDPIASTRPGDGIRAIFSRGEVRILDGISQGGRLPKDLSVALHAVKRILGGEITDCSLDSDSGNK